jgi:hypothetical protein
MIHYSDTPPSARAAKGMIRLTVRATDMAGLENAVCEIAMTPNVACHMIVALTDAIAAHNGAARCSVHAFPKPDRRRRRCRKDQD